MIHSSPIPALIDLYDRLRNDPNETVPPIGFSWQKISFRVVLERDGRLFAIQDAREVRNGRSAPVQLVVPGQSKPSGQGINPCFLWDNAQYMLGVKVDDPKPERTREAFEAYRRHHLDRRDQIDDPQFKAVCRFLERWDPSRIDEADGGALLEELGGGFGVFQIRGQPGYVHQQPAVLEYWRQQHEATAGDEATAHEAQSLVSGRPAPISRKHEPKIKGVMDGQTSGCVLVGFNEDAYTSYGKRQSYNAPVSEEEAFRYCTALNHLLSSRDHSLRLGDATAVFWSDRNIQSVSLLGSLLGLDFSNDAEHAGTVAAVRSFLDAVHRGAPHEGLDDPEAAFYILGLSPNAARISVRFWLAGTVGQFATRLGQHVRNLAMVGATDDRPLTVRRMMFETAREARDIPPQLAGETVRAVLNAAPYPQSLVAAIIRRIRADQTVCQPRAAILKACLIRNHEMEVPVSLNQDHAEPAYHLGRLFAALEKTQQDGMPGLNRTIKDGYFGSASATPAAVFPKLIRMHQHHVEKLDHGLKIHRERLVQEICSHVDHFPAHLPLTQQGLFSIGYYHQRQDFFMKHDQSPSADTETPSEEPSHA